MIRQYRCTDIDIEYFKKLADYMPRRLEIVIKARGEMTKY